MSRLIDNGDGRIKDKTTKLKWMCPSPFIGKMTWFEAKESAISLMGDSARIPSVPELLEMVCAQEEMTATNTHVSSPLMFWSSDESLSDANKAWCVSSTGEVTIMPKETKLSFTACA